MPASDTSFDFGFSAARSTQTDGTWRFRECERCPRPPLCPDCHRVVVVRYCSARHRIACQIPLDLLDFALIGRWNVAHLLYKFLPAYQRPAPSHPHAPSSAYVGERIAPVTRPGRPLRTLHGSEFPHFCEVPGRIDRGGLENCNEVSPSRTSSSSSSWIYRTRPGTGRRGRPCPPIQGNAIVQTGL